MTTEREKIVRKKYLINWRFQLKYVFLLIFLAFILLGIFAVSMHYFVNMNFGALVESGVMTSPQAVQLIEVEKGFLTRNLLKIFIAVAVLITILGIFLTHRLAGPVFALERRMRDVAAGRTKPLPFQIRKTDEFQQLASAYREMMEALEKGDMADKEKIHKLEAEIKILRVKS